LSIGTLRAAQVGALREEPLLASIGRRALVASAVATLALAGPAFATYLTEDPGNVDVAEARDADGLNDALLSRDNLTGTVILRANTVSYETITCEDGSESSIETDFTGSGTPDSYSFGKQQSSAKATGTINGTRTVSNYCTGDFEQVDDSRVVTLNLTGSKFTTTSTSKQTVKDPDGSVRVYTHKETRAVATGTFTIGATTYTAASAAITHEELALKTR
jgi:hypothetical protein